MNTYKPMDASTLTYQERKDALDLLLFITDKRNGYIKAREVAVGSKQRTYNGYNKSNGTSPTVDTDSVFLTGVIYLHGHRSVAMLDIENTFLHAESDKYVLMMLRGKLVDLLYLSLSLVLVIVTK